MTSHALVDPFSTKCPRCTSTVVIKDQDGVEYICESAVPVEIDGETVCPACLKDERDRLRDALSDIVTMIQDDPSFNDPANEPDAYAALYAAKGALGSYGSVPK